jgi:uncharacterized protein
MNANAQIAAERERRAAEPSMEDILASIRRIIADDDGPAATRHRRRSEEAQAERTPAPVVVAPVVAAEPLRAEPEPNSEPADVEPHELDPDICAFEQDYALDIEAAEEEAPLEPTAPLVSADAAASITAQFQTLAASMVINDSGLLHEYAREMLRPMLKAWLDDNLPVLVERLVRAEIERVARGGRR